LCKQGLTFKLRLFASLYFGSGLTEFCWAFSCYLVLLFLYWALVPGWTINNALPAQSPIVRRQSYPAVDNVKKSQLISGRDMLPQAL
jgi:hypothetical protein